MSSLIQTCIPDEINAAVTPASPQPVTIFYDAACPLCAREIAMLKRLDKGHGRLIARDINDPTLFPTGLGRTRDDLMARIHALGPDGNLIEGMDVFRAAYRAVGYGWLLAPTAWPLLRPLFDALYRLFAKHRVRIGHWFGRADCTTDACTPAARKA